jgi:hypothetical protein
MFMVTGQMEWNGNEILTITRKHSSLLFKHENHMVNCMARRMERRQGSTFNGEDLAFRDIRLAIVGIILEDLGIGANL